MLKLTCTGVLTAAVLGMSGCLGSVTEPQQLTFPGSREALTVKSLSAQLTAADLPAQYEKFFDFAPGSEFNSKSYTVDAGTVCYECCNNEWRMVYVVSGNAVLQMNNFRTPMTVGYAAFIPAGQNVSMFNVSDKPLELIVSSANTVQLPDTPNTAKFVQSELNNYNGMTACDTSNVINACGYNDLEIPETVNFSQYYNKSQNTVENVLGSDPDSNPGPKATKTEAGVNLDEVQTLTKPEAEAVKAGIESQEKLPKVRE